MHTKTSLERAITKRLRTAPLRLIPFHSIFASLSNVAKVVVIFSANKLLYFLPVLKIATTGIPPMTGVHQILAGTTFT